MRQRFTENSQLNIKTTQTVLSHVRGENYIIIIKEKPDGDLCFMSNMQPRLDSGPTLSLNTRRANIFPSFPSDS